MSKFESYDLSTAKDMPEEAQAAYRSGKISRAVIARYEVNGEPHETVTTLPSRSMMEQAIAENPDKWQEMPDGWVRVSLPNHTTEEL